MRRVRTSPIYFDHASSTPVHPEIIKNLSELTLVHYANSESLHEAGLTIQTMIRKSREAIASLLGVLASEITFTSGATEANNILIKGIAFAYQHKGKHLITTSVEHSSVLESFQDLEKFFGFEVTYLPVDQDGRIRVGDLEKSLRKDTTLVSIMAVNNETGTIMPIQECAKIVHSNSQAIFHVDGVQALTKIDLDLSSIDCISFSAHKINGVKGSGLFVKKKNVQIIVGKNYQDPLTQSKCGNIVRYAGNKLRSEKAATFNFGIRLVFNACATLVAQKDKLSYDKNSLTQDELQKIDHPQSVNLVWGLVIAALISFGLVLFKSFRKKK